MCWAFILCHKCTNAIKESHLCIGLLFFATNARMPLRNPICVLGFHSLPQMHECHQGIPFVCWAFILCHKCTNAIKESHLCVGLSFFATNAPMDTNSALLRIGAFPKTSRQVPAADFAEQEDQPYLKTRNVCF